MHYPVMAGEALHYLAVRPDGWYLDATAGQGGHTEALVRRLESGRVVANDRDPESLEVARRRLAPWQDRVLWLQCKFSELETGVQALGIEAFDGLLADLGVSSGQLMDPERGFSFTSPTLDMRMDRRQELTAADLINRLAERDLAELIGRYGEERRWRQRIARAICRERPFRSAQQLAETIERAVPRSGGRIHPATRTFMALRIAVNRELEELDALLEALPRLVRPGGRVVILTFHSLEDRRVKLRFRSLAQAGRAVILTKHVVRPSAEERRENAPSRSAKLRALEMK